VAGVSHAYRTRQLSTVGCVTMQVAMPGRRQRRVQQAAAGQTRVQGGDGGGSGATGTPGWGTQRTVDVPCGAEGWGAGQARPRWVPRWRVRRRRTRTLSLTLLIHSRIQHTDSGSGSSTWLEPPSTGRYTRSQPRGCVRGRRRRCLSTSGASQGGSLTNAATTLRGTRG